MPDNEFEPRPRLRTAPSSQGRRRGLEVARESPAPQARHVSLRSSIESSTPAAVGIRFGSRPGRPVRNPWTLPRESRYSPVTCPASLIPIGEVSTALNGSRIPIHARPVPTRTRDDLHSQCRGNRRSGPWKLDPVRRGVGDRTRSVDGRQRALAPEEPVALAVGPEVETHDLTARVDSEGLRPLAAGSSR